MLNHNPFFLLVRKQPTRCGTTELDLDVYTTRLSLAIIDYNLSIINSRVYLGRTNLDRGHRVTWPSVATRFVDQRCVTLRPKRPGMAGNRFYTIPSGLMGILYMIGKAPLK